MEGKRGSASDNWRQIRRQKAEEHDPERFIEALQGWGHRYLRALVGTYPAKDVVVWTPEEVDAWREVPNAFITAALREGRTLYER